MTLNEKVSKKCPKVNIRGQLFGKSLENNKLAVVHVRQLSQYRNCPIYPSPPFRGGGYVDRKWERG